MQFRVAGCFIADNTGRSSAAFRVSSDFMFERRAGSELALFGRFETHHTPFQQLLVYCKMTFRRASHFVRVCVRIFLYSHLASYTTASKLAPLSCGIFMSAHETGRPPNEGESESPSGGQALSSADIFEASSDSIFPLGDSSAVRKKQSELWIGRKLGKYQITEILGAGGMGVVLKAYDASIEREVAIKILPAHLSGNEPIRQRFIAEAKAAGKLNHPNSVTLYEVANQDDIYYLVMELVPGGSAADRIEQDGAYSVVEATRIVIDACKGLAAAHALGMVHRDIKPGNLVFSQDGSVKILDFGLAKNLDDPTLQLTREGQIVGTPYFMSPEQCDSKKVDHRSDIYSLGATYYSLLVGKNPYEGSVVNVMFAHCQSEPPDPHSIASNIPVACVSIIQRAMAKSPSDRYQSVEEMQADLESVTAALSGTGISLPSQSAIRYRSTQSVGANPATSRRHWLIAVPLLLVAIFAVSRLLFFSGNSSEETSEQAADDDTTASPIPPSGDPIYVGVLHSLTGTMAYSETPVVEATLLAIEHLNSQGGVLGRSVEPLVVDGRSEASVFVRETEKLLSEGQICTVFGCWTSASRKAVVPIFEKHDHLLVYPVQYEGIEESPNLIYTGAAPNQQIIPAVRWAYSSLNKKRWFIVGSDYVFPRIASEIIKDLSQELSAEVVGEQYMLLGSRDATAIVQQIVEAQPDVILNTINGDSNLAFFDALRGAGVTPENIPTISFSIGETDIQHLGASSMRGDFAAWNYFQSIDSPENDRFVKDFKAKYGPQRLVTDPMEAAYFGVLLWAKAVESAGNLKPAQIRRAMRNQRMRAPSGDVRIDPTTQHTFKTPRIGRIRADGLFEIVWESDEPVQPNPYPPSRTTEQWRALLHDLYTGWNNQWAAPQ